MGQIEVQVRKIKDDATSATCQGELIAYSSVNVLPMIYVGVDVKTESVLAAYCKSDGRNARGPKNLHDQV
jgi:hypothetical protein